MENKGGFVSDRVAGLPLLCYGLCPGTGCSYDMEMHMQRVHGIPCRAPLFLDTTLASGRILRGLDYYCYTMWPTILTNFPSSL